MPLPKEAAAALARLERFGAHFGLDHVRRLLAALDDPQRELPAVLVAGTNGKGSTAALLAAAGEAAGYRTGLYTSPHLETWEERVRVDGAPIGGDELGALVLEAVAAGEARGEPPTVFETLTAAAFLAFRRHAVELAVLEVGLGGRLDATNTSDPEVSVITPIGIEHKEQLGSTLGAIAGEKAGVMRRGRPTVAWGDEPEVTKALARAATAAGAELRLVGTAGSVRVETARSLPDDPWAGQEIALATPGGRLELRVPLLGAHQATNAALAWAAADAMAERRWPRLDEGTFRRGAAAWRWPGRLEAVELPPGAPCRRVLHDAAHNPHGAAALGRFLAAPPAPWPAPPVVLFGVLADKDAAAMLAALAPHAGRLVLTRPPGHRARDPRDLLPRLPPGTAAEVHPDPAAALDRALALAAGTGADTVVACGSIYLIGALRAELRRRYGVPAEG